MLVHNRGFSVHYTEEGERARARQNQTGRGKARQSQQQGVRQTKTMQDRTRYGTRGCLHYGGTTWVARTSYKRSKCHDSGCHNMKRQIEAFSLPKLNCGRKSCRQKKQSPRYESSSSSSWSSSSSSQPCNLVVCQPFPACSLSGRFRCTETPRLCIGAGPSPSCTETPRLCIWKSVPSWRAEGHKPWNNRLRLHTNTSMIASKVCLP